MAEYTTHNPGTFSWVDLGTTDTAAAKSFYCELFGWVPFDMPMPNGGTFTFFNKNDKPCAAMYELMPEQKQMNIPPHWMSYITVESAAATLEKAKELGGASIMGPMEMEEGISGLMQDPEGAMIGLWQPKSHQGIGYKYEPGALCWVEHASRNTEATVPFYEKIFGWTSNTQDMGGMIYTTFFNGEEHTCGHYIMPPELDGVPPHWLPYFMTDDIDVLLEKTANLGGTVLMPKMFVPNVGHFAVVRDPQGGVFGVLGE